jgi:hypothetical protein
LYMNHFISFSEAFGHLMMAANRYTALKYPLQYATVRFVWHICTFFNLNFNEKYANFNVKYSSFDQNNKIVVVPDVD